jgi:hypothetical protein
MVCPLCRARNARRTCPALGQDICAVCCGTKRLTEIACPPTCIYLESAQRHPAAVVKRQQERDLSVLMTALGRVSEGQLQLFFLIHTFISRFAPSTLSRLVDTHVADAAGALAESFETAGRGVLYEPQAPSVVGEELRRELKTFLADVGRGGGTRFETEAAEVLRGIERGARHEPAGMGTGAVDYLALVARLLHERPPGTPDRPALIRP